MRARKPACPPINPAASHRPVLCWPQVSSSRRTSRGSRRWSGRESAEHRATVAEATQREWARWLELLCACARTLRARADAGDEAANLGETETPAASVLDAVHRGETRRNKLKLKLRECEATERALHARVQKIRASITQQQVRAYGFTVERGTGE